MNIRNLLKEPFELPSNVISVLEENSETVTFRKKEVIVRQGEVEKSVYVIASGLARIYYPATSEDSRDENILFGEQGNMATSLTSFVMGLPAVFSIAAVTKIRAYRIDGDVIRNLYRTDMTFCRWLLELSMLQLASLEVRYTYLAPSDAYQRYLNFMRFKTPSFIRRVPGYHIASYLKISPTTLSLLRARYSRDMANRIEYDREFLDSVGITGQTPE